MARVFEIGNSLREARVRRRVDFNQAELATKIRVKYLRALEDERFDELPSQTYVKGFLRTYAEYLGLDGQLYVDEFNSRFVAGGEPSQRRAPAALVGAARSGGTAGSRRGIVLARRRPSWPLVTLVVAAAWQSSGSGAEEPPAPTSRTRAKSTRRRGAVPFLQIQAVAGPSYVAVHRSSPTGKLLFQGTIERGQHRAVQRQALLDQRQLAREPPHRRARQAGAAARRQAASRSR